MCRFVDGEQHAHPNSVVLRSLSLVLVQFDVRSILHTLLPEVPVPSIPHLGLELPGPAYVHRLQHVRPMRWKKNHSDVVFEEDSHRSLVIPAGRVVEEQNGRARFQSVFRSVDLQPLADPLRPFLQNLLRDPSRMGVGHVELPLVDVLEPSLCAPEPGDHGKQGRAVSEAVEPRKDGEMLVSTVEHS